MKSLKSLAVLLFLSYSVNAQTINSKFSEIQKTSNLPGFVVAIVKNDSVCFKGCFGNRNL